MRKLRKLQILRLAVLVCCLLISGILAFWNHHLSGLLPGQQAAERWSNESAQISVFLRPEAEFSTDSIQSLHETIDAELTSKSLKPEQKYARLWYDAYSTQAGQTEVTGNRKGHTDALMTAVGGDFFLIHAPELVSGGYFTEQDGMHDRVVIDMQLAWDLFGSSDVAGMEITVQGISCLVAGVIQPETDYASKTAYGTMPRIYIPYIMYQQFDSENAGHISCYEAVLPNPVRNFAKELLKYGCYFSFGGAVTFRNARKFEEIVGSIPIGRILPETDSPYMAPEPLRGRRNDPGNLKYIYPRLASLMGLDTETAAKQFLANSERFFGIRAEKIPGAAANRAELTK